MKEVKLIDIDEQVLTHFHRDWGYKSRWGQEVIRFLHTNHGFSLVAIRAGEPIGLISVRWNPLPAPLADCVEGYIDLIEVFIGYKRQGVARLMVSEVIDRAKKCGAYQLRAWSSKDKVEAILMWKALGFGLCPATTYPGGHGVEGFYVTRLINS